MQRIANYGSFLQAYGLKSILEELDCDVQFVDYHIEKCLVDNKNRPIILRKISKVFDVFKYKTNIKNKIKYIKYKKNYAKNYYHLMGIDVNNMNYNPKLDVLVIGSDEVFNCVQDNPNIGFSSELFGVNNNAKKLISYAGSFWNTSIEKIKYYGIEKELSKYFKKFDFISVRDQNSYDIINYLTNKHPKIHLDPVLIYDYINKCNKIPNNVKHDKYLLLYGYSGRFSMDECKLIQKFAKNNQLKIICIGGIQHICDEFIDCNPFEVISYFKNADYIITDTFHGTIMSIITHNQFVSIVRKSVKTSYGNEEKLTYLLKDLNLQNRIIKDINMLDNVLLEKISYIETDKIIENERQNAINYLSGCL